MKKYRKYIILFVLTALGFGAAYTLPGAVAAMAPQVETLRLETQDIAITVRCNGTIENAARQEVKSEMPLCIGRMAVRQGERVEEGDLLFTVDQAATEQAITLLSGLSEGGADSVLAADAAISQGLFSAQIPEAVYAPSAGIVDALAVEDGELLMPQNAALILSDGDGMIMRAAFSESIISSVAVGQEARITGNGFRGQTFGGVIASLADSAKQVVRSTGTETVVEGIVRLEENADEVLRAGYNAQAEIITGIREDALLVPYEAVGQDQDNRKYIYRLKDGWAYKEYIRTGTETADGMEVLAGAQSGWEIIKNPEQLNGDSVRVISQSAEEGEK